MDTAIKPIGYRVAGGIFILFLLAALLPRIGLILGGYSYADDYAADYRPYLESYRPLLAADIYFWQHAFGPDYLTSPLPKLLSAVWYSLALIVGLRLSVALGFSIRSYVCVGVILLLHPAFNDLILWGVLASSALSLLLVMLGAVLFATSRLQWVRAAGLLSLTLGGAGNQLCASAGVVLAVIIWLYSRSDEATQRRPKLGTLLVIALLPLFASAASLGIMRYGLHLEDFQSRTIAVETDAASFVRSKFYVLSNAFANLFQAPLQMLIGKQAALRAFWPVSLGIPLLLVGWFRLACHVPWRCAALLSISIHVTFVLALSPLLGTTATPSGFRILGPTLVLLVLTVAALTSVKVSGVLRALAPAAGVVLGFGFALATWKDVTVRKKAWDRDAAFAEQVSIGQRARGLAKVAICSQGIRTPPLIGDGILESYGTRTIDSYSVWFTQFQLSYMQHRNIPVDIAGTSIARPSSNERQHYRLGETPLDISTFDDPEESRLVLCGR